MDLLSFVLRLHSGLSFGIRHVYVIGSYLEGLGHVLGVGLIPLGLGTIIVATRFGVDQRGFYGRKFGRNTMMNGLTYRSVHLLFTRSLHAQPQGTRRGQQGAGLYGGLLGGVPCKGITIKRVTFDASGLGTSVTSQCGIARTIASRHLFPLVNGHLYVFSTRDQAI